jgi:bifunctional non-homologous end joining protein LigD
MRQATLLVVKPPEGQHWIHEIKYDGYRCQVLVERAQARVLEDERGNSSTKKL